jgi:membrane-anchored protein YejM (alkaline phosphatase superfamily)
MDALANRGIRFANAFSTAPLTLPSVTSILTSTYFSQHQVPDNHSAYDRRFPTIADVLKRNGYTTAAFVGNAVLRPNRNLDSGFDVYNAYLPSTEINRRLPERNAPQLTRAALHWLETHNGERFFLWLHYQDPHAPYTPPDPFQNAFAAPPSGKALHIAKDPDGRGGIPPYAALPGIFDPAVFVARYDGEIRAVDDSIREVIESLSQLKLDQNTIIVITADHGEALGEGDYYFRHGHNVTPDLTDVPLILVAPGKQREIVDHPVSTIDIATTLLQMLEITPPPTFQGQSLFDNDPNRKCISEQPQVRWAMIQKSKRTIYERSGVFESIADESDEKAIHSWIEKHLGGGLVFAIKGSAASRASIVSDRGFEAVFLFNSENNDHIEIGETNISCSLTLAGDDQDYLFVLPKEGSSLQIRNAAAWSSNRARLPEAFAANAIPISSRLPQSADFPGPGILVLRRSGAATHLLLTPEEQEEMRSLGYTNQ